VRLGDELGAAVAEHLRRAVGALGVEGVEGFGGLSGAVRDGAVDAGPVLDGVYKAPVGNGRHREAGGVAQRGRVVGGGGREQGVGPGEEAEAVLGGLGPSRVLAEGLPGTLLGYGPPDRRPEQARDVPDEAASAGEKRRSSWEWAPSTPKCVSRSGWRRSRRSRCRGRAGAGHP
jgi:hypothetical protein